MPLNTFIKDQVLKIGEWRLYINFNDIIQRGNHPNIGKLWTEDVDILRESLPAE